MEQNFQTSFIPKRPIVKEDLASSRPVSVFLIIALFILFTVLLTAGGLYFYRGIVQKNITGMENDLNLAKGRFEPQRITELQTLDKRLRAATEILNNHVAVTPIFSALEQITMKTIRFTKFDYELGGDSDSRTVDIKISGQAADYRSIALQSDLFGKNKNFIDPIFSNLTLDDTGNVAFDLEFSVDPSFFNYEQTLLRQS